MNFDTFEQLVHHVCFLSTAELRVCYNINCLFGPSTQMWGSRVWLDLCRILVGPLCFLIPPDHALIVEVLQTMHWATSPRKETCLPRWLNWGYLSQRKPVTLIIVFLWLAWNHEQGDDLQEAKPCRTRTKYLTRIPSINDLLCLSSLCTTSLLK